MEAPARSAFHRSQSYGYIEGGCAFGVSSHTQAEFVEDAIRDYANETSKIMHLAADMAHETLAPVEERAEEMLHKFDDRTTIAEQKAAAGE